jgi:hypothetical protein
VKRELREDTSAIIEAMSTMKWVEEIVGGVESWPTYMILNMFVCPPTEHSMKKVAAFMYGNGVPVEMAAVLRRL